MLTSTDIGWIAGFLEGEGCFSQNAAASIYAKQVSIEPLEQLVRLVGGTIYRLAIGRNGPRQAIHQWYIGGSDAAGLGMTIYCLMSPRRQSQIQVMLTVWKSADLRRMLKAAQRFGAEVA